MTKPTLMFAVLAAAISLASCGGSSEGPAGETGRPTSAVSVTNVTTPERALVTASGDAQQGDAPEVFGVDEVIRFDPGGTSATISNAVVRGERNRYTLDATAGQTMNIIVESLEANALFDVLGPDGTLLAAEVTSASIVLPEDGTYSLILGGTRGNASYDLTVEIPSG